MKGSQEKMNQILPGAEPFFFPGNDTACLLIHGFTGTPKEMRWMGEYLSARGYTVLGIRLAGHATTPSDLVRTRWEDWLASVEDGVNLLHGYRHVYFMGLSMGGSLALLAGARYPGEGVVALSAPYDMPGSGPKALLPLLKFLPIGIPKGKPDWHDPEAGKDHISYADYPLRAVAEFNDLLAVLRSDLPRVRIPVQIIQSRQDQTVLPENAEKIYRQLGSGDKNLLWVENSGHVIPREPEREKAFQAAAAFIERVNSLP